MCLCVSSTSVFLFLSRSCLCMELLQMEYVLIHYNMSTCDNRIWLQRHLFIDSYVSFCVFLSHILSLIPFCPSFFSLTLFLSHSISLASSFSLSLFLSLSLSYSLSLTHTALVVYCTKSRRAERYWQKTLLQMEEMESQIREEIRKGSEPHTHTCTLLYWLEFLCDW